jgi:beta-lactamase class D
MRLLLITLFFSLSSAWAVGDLTPLLGERDGCLIVAELRTGKRLKVFNEKRCDQRLSPASSFKIAAALMAFETGVLENENQSIKWDRVRRSREELNQDQTPYSWMRDSVLWVTQWITPQLGLDTIKKYLKKFSYGNQDFSGGIREAWVDSSLKISANEQVNFIRNLWNEKLPVSKKAMGLTKKIIFIKKLGEYSSIYGKTGTGCIDKGCVEHPARMLGWFVGVLNNGEKDFVVVANASDLKKFERPAGPRIRETAISLLGQLHLIR